MFPARGRTARQTSSWRSARTGREREVLVIRCALAVIAIPSLRVEVNGSGGATGESLSRLPCKPLQACDLNDGRQCGRVALRSHRLAG